MQVTDNKNGTFTVNLTVAEMLAIGTSAHSHWVNYSFPGTEDDPIMCALRALAVDAREAMKPHHQFIRNYNNEFHKKFGDKVIDQDSLNDLNVKINKTLDKFAEEDKDLN